VVVEVKETVLILEPLEEMVVLAEVEAPLAHLGHRLEVLEILL